MAYNKKIRLYLVIILLAGWAVTLLIAQIYREQKFYRDSRVLMGTFFEVVSPDKRAANIVFQEVTRLENLLSKYKEDSQVARLNRSGKISASNEVFKIIELAKEFSRKTDQAFDITVGPLVDLWGFTKLDFRVPAGSKIKQTLKLVGADKIILNQN
ncbi:MAG: FAD:protein FMN transferase, partial [Candidatus Omnitrophica bacterium]|nr:FAD:protein FMN transferase [Candidatus Omnitrophota bacterium]